MKLSVACGVLLTLGWMGVSHAQQPGNDAMRDEIVAQERAGLDALKRGDVQAFADATADDAVFVDAAGPATKAEVVKNVQGFRLTDYAISDVRFVRLAADSGLIVYRITETGTSHGHEFTAKVIVSSIWAKHGGKWLCEFSQETAARQAPAAVMPVSR
jgi:ketosteroid isomerase-like protein